MLWPPHRFLLLSSHKNTQNTNYLGL